MPLIAFFRQAIRTLYPIMTLENLDPAVFKALAYSLCVIAFLFTYLYTRKAKYTNISTVCILCLLTTGIAYILFQFISNAPVIITSGTLFYAGIVASAGALVNFVRF